MEHDDDPVFRLSTILPEDFDGRQSIIDRFKDDPVRAVKSYRELDKMVSSTHRVPRKDADPEEWKKFHRIMGAPESPDGYGIPDPLEGPIRETFDRMRKEALEAGVPVQAWERMAKAAAEAAQARAEEAKKQREEQIQKLVAEVGDAQSAAEISKEIAGKIGGEELAKQVEESGLTENAAFLKIMQKVREIVSEDSISGGIGGSSADRGELAQAMELAKKGREILSSGTIENRRDPKHSEMYNEYLEIVRKLESLGFEGGVTDPRLQERNIYGV